MGNLFSLSYWFNPLPGPWVAIYLKLISAFFVLLVVVGLIAWQLSKRDKDDKLTAKLWLKIEYFSLTLGIVGLLLLLIRQQNIYFLSMPFWFLLLIVVALIWLYKIIKYVLREMPERRKELEEKKIKEKYLPR